MGTKMTNSQTAMNMGTAPFADTEEDARKRLMQEDQAAGAATAQQQSMATGQTPSAWDAMSAYADSGPSGAWDAINQKAMKKKGG